MTQHYNFKTNQYGLHNKLLSTFYFAVKLIGRLTTRFRNNHVTHEHCVKYLFHATIHTELGRFLRSFYGLLYKFNHCFVILKERRGAPGTTYETRRGTLYNERITFYGNVIAWLVDFLFCILIYRLDLTPLFLANGLSVIYYTISFYFVHKRWYGIFFAGLFIEVVYNASSRPLYSVGRSTCIISSS